MVDVIDPNLDLGLVQMPLAANGALAAVKALQQ